MTRHLWGSGAALLTLTALGPTAAHAFCGTYVGTPGEELYSGASQVVIAREGERTVLTFANDYQGNLQEFAMVVPVPTILAEGDVRVVEASHIDRISEYVGPRLVEYQCADFEWEEWQNDGGWEGGGGGCNADDADFDDTDVAFDASVDPPSLDVTVENEFQAGEYDIVILSSEDSGDLVKWLRNEGYGVDDTAVDMLGDYIDSGAYFFAAKVRLDEVPTEPGPEGRPFLTPLQVTYTERSFGLPIRLGTLNSPGTQDLLITTLTSEQAGSIGIANYPEVALTNECMWDEARHGALDAMLDAEMTAQVDANAGAAWVQTYSWSGAKCDPCPGGGPLDADTLAAFGFEGGSQSAHATRLWVRYTAEAATQDLMFYETGDPYEMDQLRFILYKSELENRFPVCGEGMVQNPGTCDTTEARVRRSNAGYWPVALGGLLALGGVLVRRRRR